MLADQLGALHLAADDAAHVEAQWQAARAKWPQVALDAGAFAAWIRARATSGAEVRRELSSQLGSSGNVESLARGVLSQLELTRSMFGVD